jgi:hypothetical protein
MTTAAGLAFFILTDADRFRFFRKRSVFDSTSEGCTNSEDEKLRLSKAGRRPVRVDTFSSPAAFFFFFFFFFFLSKVVDKEPSFSLDADEVIDEWTGFFLVVVGGVVGTLLLVVVVCRSRATA